MFKVDLAQNRIARLARRRFADLNLHERRHLQEWLANQPDALGEDLLIIQKEFDRFADTRERLDLLALDKDGSLVVIENTLALRRRKDRADSPLRQLRYERAVFYNQVGRNAQARSELERVYAEDPGFEDVRERLGLELNE